MFIWITIYIFMSETNKHIFLFQTGIVTHEIGHAMGKGYSIWNPEGGGGMENFTETPSHICIESLSKCYEME